MIIATICANLLVYAFTAYFLMESKGHYEARAEVQTQNVASAIDRSISDRIEKIDLSLQTIVDEAEKGLAGRGIDEKNIRELMMRQEVRITEIDAFRLANANGQVIIGKGISKTSLPSILDRDYYLYLRNHADAGLYVTKPMFGRIAKQHIIIFARRINNPDGTFAGEVHAAAGLEHFSQLLTAFNLGASGTLILRDADLGLITRAPPIPEKKAGQVGDKGVSPEFRQLVESGAATATYYISNSPDGFERILTFRRLEKVPMIVLAGVASNDYLAEWKSQSILATGSALVFTLVSIAYLALLQRLFKQVTSSELSLSESEFFLRQSQRVGQIGGWRANPESNSLVWTEGVYEIVEVPRDYKPDLESGLDYYLPESREQVVACLKRTLETSEPFSIQVQLRGAASGTLKWVELRGQPHHDATGQVDYLMGTIQDISAIKNAEEELREYWQHLEELVTQRTAELREATEYNRTLFETSPIGLALAGFDGKLLDVNPAYLRIIGFSESEAKKLSYWDITPKEYAQQEQLQLERVDIMQAR